jgi:hypothetical protein
MKHLFLTISFMALQPVGALPEATEAVIPNISLMHKV